MATVTRSQPRKIGAYTVLAKLGEGAASVLYAVQHPKTKQVSALKFVEKTDEKSARGHSEQVVRGKLHPRLFLSRPRRGDPDPTKKRPPPERPAGGAGSDQLPGSFQAKRAPFIQPLSSKRRARNS